MNSQGKAWLITQIPKTKQQDGDSNQCLVKADRSVIGEAVCEGAYDLISGANRNQSSVLEAGEQRFLIEPLCQAGEVYVFGAGHISQQLDLALSERGIVQAQNLREIALGLWEGLPFTEIQQRFPDEVEKRGCDIVHYRPPGGESFLDCAFRIADAFLEILHATTGDILIVGHAGVNRILLCEALGKSLWELFEIRQDYGCLNVLSYDESVLRADRWNFKVGHY